MSEQIVQDLSALAQKTVDMAIGAGADAAEVMVSDGSELTVKVRLGEPELVQEAGSRSLGIRVFKDHQQANTYTSDMRPAELARLVSETIELATFAEPDELNELPEPSLLATSLPELELYDRTAEDLEAKTAIEWAITGERAAMDADKRVTNSEGASYSRVLGATAFATSGGFVGGYRGSYSSFYVEPICDDKDGKKRNGYYWTAARFVDELEDPASVGHRAAERTLAKLGARKVDTCDTAVVFHPDAAKSIIGMIFSVANGASFYRKSSYLLDREGTAVASDLVTLVDDPLIVRGPGSRPFDGDGLATRVNPVISAGILKPVLCDTYSARRLGRASTGSAGRSVGGSPSPTTSNLVMTPGSGTHEDIIADTKQGLLVMSMMGFGFNPITGDFSRGAQGFWIENGKIAFPVSEVTISANFNDLLTHIDRVGVDVDRRSSTMVPTIRVSQMTVAGK